MVSRQRPKYQQKNFLDISFLFTIQNVASCSTLCHLENYLFHLYVCFKIVTHGNIEKKHH